MSMDKLQQVLQLVNPSRKLNYVIVRHETNADLTNARLANIRKNDEIFEPLTDQLQNREETTDYIKMLNRFYELVSRISQSAFIKYVNFCDYLIFDDFGLYTPDVAMCFEMWKYLLRAGIGVPKLILIGQIDVEWLKLESEITVKMMISGSRYNFGKLEYKRITGNIRNNIGTHQLVPSFSLSDLYFYYTPTKNVVVAPVTLHYFTRMNRNTVYVPFKFKLEYNLSQFPAYALTWYAMRAISVGIQPTDLGFAKEVIDKLVENQFVQLSTDGEQVESILAKGALYSRLKLSNFAMKCLMTWYSEAPDMIYQGAVTCILIDHANSYFACENCDICKNGRAVCQEMSLLTTTSHRETISQFQESISPFVFVLKFILSNDPSTVNTSQFERDLLNTKTMSKVWEKCMFAKKQLSNAVDGSVSLERVLNVATLVLQKNGAAVYENRNGSYYCVDQNRPNVRLSDAHFGHPNKILPFNVKNREESDSARHSRLQMVELYL